MDLTHIAARRQIGRKVSGVAAMLLPFTAEGHIDADSFARCLQAVTRCGLRPAVNMDTGYVNLLAAEERARVLQIAQETLAGQPFIAGAYIEGQDGEPAELYRREIAQIAEHGGTPILFQTSRLHGAPVSQIVSVYERAVCDVPEAYAFELGRMFAPNGEIWSEEIVAGLMQIPALRGMKHSSLDRRIEIARLDLRDRVRPAFTVFTGNDLGLDMIEYGSDYLLGLAAFAPETFAERDHLWEAGDAGYLALADALQFLGNVAFRPPVPAYKHSAAVFLHLTGRIATDRTHPRSPERPSWEREILRSCAERLGLL
ncbi:MAG TPA: dihydrodipicolinate synthase family protein [Chthonomonadaceae bacterium]|nr:dihydrodipicolinate synthase family protein [Chthonomonadaceae bacterium]